MKKLFFVLTFIIFCALTTSVSEAGVCDPYKQMPDLKFSTSYGKLKYDTSYSRRQLTTLGEQFGILEQGLFASGLATVNVAYQLSVSTVSHRATDSVICVVPKIVNIYIGYQEPTIYLAKELKKDSCEYNVVLRHEQTHQQINISALEYFIPQLRKAAISVIGNAKPLEIKDLKDFDTATQQFVKRYTRQLEPLINFFKTELLKEQGKLDNRNNYKMEDNLCKYYHAHE